MAKAEQQDRPERELEPEESEDFADYRDEVERLRADQTSNLEAIEEIEGEQERLAQELSERQKLARLHAAALAATNGDDA